MGIESPTAGWRTWLGLTLFVASIGWPILIPVLLLIGASSAVTAAFSGVMVVVADLLILANALASGSRHACTSERENRTLTR